MKATCCRCKEKPAVGKWRGGVYCEEHMPRLEKSDPNQPLGIGIRYKESPHGRVIKGKKGNLSQKSKQKMRTRMGMNYILAK